MPFCAILKTLKDAGDTKGADPMEVSMSIASSFSFDVTRGVDVMRGTQVVEHFDGADALEKALALVATGAGRYVRYWE